jgi:hypothetical protein
MNLEESSVKPSAAYLFLIDDGVVDIEQVKEILLFGRLMRTNAQMVR